MKNLLSFLLFLSFITFIKAQNQLFTYRIALANDPQKSTQTAILRCQAGNKINTQATMEVWGKYTANDPERAIVLGYAKVTKVRENDVEVRIELLDAAQPVTEGDFVMVPIDISPSMSKYRVLVKNSIRLQDGEGNFLPYWNEGELALSLTDGQIHAMLKNDIQMVAKFMREEMTHTIAKGKYEGQSLFDVMEKVTEEDLVQFMSFIDQNPLAYRGNDWKIAEIYATWLDNGMPGGSSFTITSTETGASITENIDLSNKTSKCAKTFLDLTTGKMNGLLPSASQAEVTSALPCFTGTDEDGASYNCGGGVYYLNHTFFFYTGNDYIEIRSGYEGGVSQYLFHKTTAEIKKQLGKPTVDVTNPKNKAKYGDEYESVEGFYLYKKPYGTLYIRFDVNHRVTAYGTSTHAPQEMVLCW